MPAACRPLTYGGVDGYAVDDGGGHRPDALLAAAAQVAAPYEADDLLLVSGRQVGHQPPPVRL